MRRNEWPISIDPELERGLDGLLEHAGIQYKKQVRTRSGRRRRKALVRVLVTVAIPQAAHAAVPRPQR